MSNGYCTLLAENGDRCAIGALAPEAKSLFDATDSLEAQGVDYFLLIDLRRAHDEAEDNKFKDRLKRVAERYGLEWRHG